MYDRYKAVSYKPKPSPTRPGRKWETGNGRSHLLGDAWHWDILELCAYVSLAGFYSIVLSMFFEQLGAKWDKIRWFWSWLIPA